MPYNFLQPESVSLNEFDTVFNVLTPDQTSAIIGQHMAQPNECGSMLLRYNAADATPNTANRMKMLRYKVSAAGLITITALRMLDTNNDTGFNGVDFTAVVENNMIVFRVVGTANPVLHTLRMEITKGVFGIA